MIIRRSATQEDLDRLGSIVIPFPITDPRPSSGVHEPDLEHEHENDDREGGEQRNASETGG